MDFLNESQRRAVFAKVLEAVDEKFMGSDPAMDISILRVKKDVLLDANKEFKKSYSVYKGPIGDPGTLKKRDKIVIEGFPLGLKQSKTTEGIVSEPNFLDEHEEGVGHAVDVVHLAPAAVGAQVTVRAVLELSDRVVVLNEGEVIAAGDPRDVLRSPRVVEVYIGKVHVA